jgi:MSHA pilin protein MshD
MRTNRNPHRSHAGFSLIELIMFIVIVSAGIVGILLVLNTTVKSSADPMIRKQMLAIAEALLEEVQMMPFTYCDPTDANASTATSAVIGAGGCATTLEAMGPDVGETRTSAANPFNNVNDYYVPATGYVLNSPITDLTGAIAAPSGYSAKIEIVPEVLNGIPAAESLRILVTVNQGSTVAAGGDSIALEGYRTRHSPNFVP